MLVKVMDYGFSRKLFKYYVIYKISDIDEETRKKLEERVEDELQDKSGVLYLTTYFDKDYFPFKSEEARMLPSDFLAREEIEMTAYLLSILED